MERTTDQVVALTKVRKMRVDINMEADQEHWRVWNDGQGRRATNVIPWSVKRLRDGTFWTATFQVTGGENVRLCDQYG